MNYELLFLKSLALTIFIETVVMVIYFQYIVKLKEIQVSRLLVTGFIASFASLPYLWFIFPNFIDQKIAYVIIGESFAILVETMIIGAILRIKFMKSFACSLACNLISFFTGLMISWP